MIGSFKCHTAQGMWQAEKSSWTCYLAQYTGRVFVVELRKVTEAGKLNFCLKELFPQRLYVCVSVCGQFIQSVY